MSGCRSYCKQGATVRLNQAQAEVEVGRQQAWRVQVEVGFQQPWRLAHRSLQQVAALGACPEHEYRFPCLLNPDAIKWCAALVTLMT